MKEANLLQVCNIHHSSTLKFDFMKPTVRCPVIYNCVTLHKKHISWQTTETCFVLCVISYSEKQVSITVSQIT